MLTLSEETWAGPGALSLKGRRRRFRWSRLLWSMVYPRRAERILPTVSGVALIALSLAIGMAAYNAANNILFITLSLLLACLILSGVLSWFNFRGVSWRLQSTPPFRVGQSAAMVIELRNSKRFLPTYGLQFELNAPGESKEVLVGMRDRLDPDGGVQRLEWVFRPTARGRQVMEILSVGSLFPFGFLHKHLAGELRQDVIIWPAPVSYQRHRGPASQRPQGGEPMARVGQSGDLLALRTYASGDSHRLIHWKASARLRKLMVRQFAAETQEGYSLWLTTPAEVWTRPEQFELLCSLAVTLAEDLFKQGRLRTVSLNDAAPRQIRRVRDLEAFFDEVALVSPVPAAAARSASPFVAVSVPGPSRRHVITFTPDGARGVAAHVDGHKTATA